jgi:hypothetical protein
MCPNEAFCLKIHYLPLKASAGDFLPNHQRIQYSAYAANLGHYIYNPGPAFIHK